MITRSPQRSVSAPGTGRRRPISMRADENVQVANDASDARENALTHAKLYRCDVPGCSRTSGFASLNDRERHVRSVHGQLSTVNPPIGYVCAACVQDGVQDPKFWPRRDNFKAHIRRLHTKDWTEDHLLEISKAPRPEEAPSGTGCLSRRRSMSEISANSVGSRTPSRRRAHTGYVSDQENNDFYFTKNFDYVPRINSSVNPNLHLFRTMPQASTAANAVISDAKVISGAEFHAPEVPQEGYKCDVCGKVKHRDCDLKKHMKRHTRPYGCTFPNCFRKFGSRNDWKRHESGQHFLEEQWKCGFPVQDGSTICNRRPWFSKAQMLRHLRGPEHHISNRADLERICDESHLGPEGRVHFWCGFCKRLIVQPEYTPNAWENRFKHIADHFEVDKWNIDDWMSEQDGPDADGESDVETHTDGDNSFANSLQGQSDATSTQNKREALDGQTQADDCTPGTLYKTNDDLLSQDEQPVHAKAGFERQRLLQKVENLTSRLVSQESGFPSVTALEGKDDTIDLAHSDSPGCPSEEAVKPASATIAVPMLERLIRRVETMLHTTEPISPRSSTTQSRKSPDAWPAHLTGGSISGTTEWLGEENWQLTANSSNSSARQGGKRAANSSPERDVDRAKAAQTKRARRDQKQATASGKQFPCLFYIGDPATFATDIQRYGHMSQLLSVFKPVEHVRYRQAGIPSDGPCQCIETVFDLWMALYRIAFPGQGDPDVDFYGSSSEQETADQVTMNDGDDHLPLTADNDPVSQLAIDPDHVLPSTEPTFDGPDIPFPDLDNLDASFLDSGADGAACSDVTVPSALLNTFLQKVAVLEQRHSQPTQREGLLEGILGMVWQSLCKTGSPDCHPDAPLFKTVSAAVPGVTSVAPRVDLTTQTWAGSQSRSAQHGFDDYFSTMDVNTIWPELLRPGTGADPSSKLPQPSDSGYGSRRWDET
ncbi:Transcriptional regulator CRZ1, partial [Pseudocercospora fuligena]